MINDRDFHSLILSEKSIGVTKGDFLTFNKARQYVIEYMACLIVLP